MTKTKIVLLGSNGMLGVDLVKNAPSNIELLAWTRRDLDLTQPPHVQGRLLEEKPNVIINAAAYSHVDGAEKDPAAKLVNADGPRDMALAANSIGALFVHVSTDYVFDGKKGSAYTESDPVSPRGKYAESKAQGETGARLAERHYILRTSALYGTGRVNHAQRMLEAIDKKQSMNLATDMICSPTYTHDLSLWIYQLIEKRPPMGTYHLVHRGCCSRFDFAARLCEMVNATKPYPIKPVTIASLNLPAPRPGAVCLSTDKWEKAMGKLPSWEEGLRAYLKAVGR